MCSCGSAVTRSMARMRRAAAVGSPRCSSIMTPDQKVATGLAMPLPTMSKAVPWIGSNIEGKRRTPLRLAGLRLAVGAMPTGGVSSSAIARLPTQAQTDQRVAVCDADGFGGDPSTAPPPAPAWAQNLARRQRLTQAGMVATQALREGDRPSSSSGPDLKDKS